MKISITDLSVNMDLGNNGISLIVYKNDGKLKGTIRFGKATIDR